MAGEFDDLEDIQEAYALMANNIERDIRNALSILRAIDTQDKRKAAIIATAILKLEELLK